MERKNGKRLVQKSGQKSWTKNEKKTEKRKNGKKLFFSVFLFFYFFFKLISNPAGYFHMFHVLLCRRFFGSLLGGLGLLQGSGWWRPHRTGPYRPDPRWPARVSPPNTPPAPTHAPVCSRIDGDDEVIVYSYTRFLVKIWQKNHLYVYTKIDKKW